jgi:RNA polymerase sigma-70 factor (ECF subfamily)
MESAVRSEAARVLMGFLDGLEENKREVFVLAELEQMTLAEVSEAIGAPLQTVYSRLRTARDEFEDAVARHHAHTHWRERCASSAHKRG